MVSSESKKSSSTKPMLEARAATSIHWQAKAPDRAIVFVLAPAVPTAAEEAASRFAAVRAVAEGSHVRVSIFTFVCVAAAAARFCRAGACRINSGKGTRPGQTTQQAMKSDAVRISVPGCSSSSAAEPVASAS